MPRASILTADLGKGLQFRLQATGPYLGMLIRMEAACYLCTALFA